MVCIKYRNTCSGTSYKGTETAVEGRPTRPFICAQINIAPNFSLDFFLDALVPQREEENSAHQGDPADDRGNRESMLLLRIDLDGADVHGLLSRSVAKALVDKSDYADNDEEDGDYRFRIHFCLVLDFRRRETAHISTHPDGSKPWSAGFY